MRKIEIFDTTLRDGAQARGISFSVEDKLAITEVLDNMGIAFIEAGNPGSNPKDLEFFEKVSHPPKDDRLRPPAFRLQRSTIISVPTQSMFVSIDDPPWLIKGRGMPTTGASPITIIRLMAM